MVNYRRYSEKEDYDAVCMLMLEHEYTNFPEKLGGTAIVAENERGKIVGFVWALTAHNSECAYINYFLVHRDYRSHLDIGHGLMFMLMGMLDRAGIHRIHGVIMGDTEYETSLARTFDSVGMKVSPAKYSVVGDTIEILSGMLRRYYGRRETSHRDQAT